MEDELPPVEEYLSEADRDTLDAHVWNEAATKWIAVWLHRLETTAFHGEERNFSIQEQDHNDCELVRFLMDVGTCSFSEADVVARVIAENVEQVYGLLQKSQRSFDWAQSTYDGLVERSVMLKWSWETSHRDTPPEKQSPTSSYRFVLRWSVIELPWMYTPREWTLLTISLWRLV